eukprot:9135460-Pyramimonas_sp.AAC.2
MPDVRMRPKGTNAWIGSCHNVEPKLLTMHRTSGSHISSSWLMRLAGARTTASPQILAPDSHGTPS